MQAVAAHVVEPVAIAGVHGRGGVDAAAIAVAQRVIALPARDDGLAGGHGVEHVRLGGVEQLAIHGVEVLGAAVALVEDGGEAEVEAAGHEHGHGVDLALEAIAAQHLARLGPVEEVRAFTAGLHAHAVAPAAGHDAVKAALFVEVGEVVAVGARVVFRPGDHIAPVFAIRGEVDGHVARLHAGEVHLGDHLVAAVGVGIVRVEHDAGAVGEGGDEVVVAIATELDQTEVGFFPVDAIRAARVGDADAAAGRGAIVAQGALRLRGGGGVLIVPEERVVAAVHALFGIVDDVGIAVVEAHFPGARRVGEEIFGEQRPVFCVLFHGGDAQTRVAHALRLQKAAIQKQIRAHMGHSFELLII